MRYLITADGNEPFFTEWFESENNYNADINMVVYDLQDGIYTTDGIIWQDIMEDHL